MHVKFLVGHGGKINQIVWHPLKHDLLLSASQDGSLRLWNALTQVQIAIFVGRHAHRYQVLTTAFHMSGALAGSGGMDNTVKLWALDTPELVRATSASYKYDLATASHAFPTVLVDTPLYSTLKVHSEYVDYLEFVGNLIASKCATDISHKVVLWAPELSGSNDDVLVLREFLVPLSEHWFVKGAVDPTGRYLAMGNELGQCLLYSLYGDDEEAEAEAKVSDVHDRKHAKPAVSGVVTAEPAARVEGGALPKEAGRAGYVSGELSYGSSAPAPAPAQTADAAATASGVEALHNALMQQFAADTTRNMASLACVCKTPAILTAKRQQGGSDASLAPALPGATLMADPSTPLVEPQHVLSHSSIRSELRHVVFSSDGRQLFCGTDDGVLARWILRG